MAIFLDIALQTLYLTLKIWNFSKGLSLQHSTMDPDQLLKKISDLQAEIDRLRSAESEHQRSRERLNLMVELTRNLTLDLDELLEQSLQRLAHTLPQADIGVIYLYDHRKELLIPKACFGYDREPLLQIRLKPGESMSGKVFLQGRSILVHTPGQVKQEAGPLSERNQALYSKATQRARITSNICVPLQTPAEKFIGTLTLSSSHSTFTQLDLSLLEGVAGQIGHAASHAQLFSALRESERKYRLLVEHLPVGISETTPDGTPLYFNQNALDINGYSREDIEHLNAADLYVNPRDREDLAANLQKFGHHSYEHPLRQKNGRTIWVRGTTRAIRDESDQIVSYLGIQQDISKEYILQQRRQAVESVRREVWGMQRESDIERVLVSVRSNLTDLGIPFQACGINIVDGTSDPPTVRFHSMRKDGEWVRTDGEKAGLTVLRFWRGGEPVYRTDLDTSDPYSERDIINSITAHPVRSVLDIPFAYGTLAFNSSRPDAFSQQDIELMRELAGVLNEGFQRLADLRALDVKDEQFRHAQKMEAIGHLAGGISHDFNNLITVINGYSAFLLDEFSKDDPYHSDLNEIHQAGQRAATLVRQLLAFSRRQTVAPEVINLNEVVLELNQMLQRLIGEDIQLQVSTISQQATVYADRSQLEQIVINLAINARDAMPHGGHLDLSTSLLQVDAESAQRYVHLEPGTYVRLAVSDTGSGIDEQTLSHIFEPFFTTKEVGKGTGLGLSMAYGAVRQNHGHIQVRSQLERGTTFEILLPQTNTLPTREINKSTATVGGSETVFLVEDEDMVRDLGVRLLERNGYRVLSASNGADALQQIERHRGPIHLLITDVVMPGIDGPELAQRLAPLRPETRVLFISGYVHSTHEERSGMAPESILRKPFSEEHLTRKVRSILGD
ncbi:MAG: PAS domain S-box-containing protein [Candidatus Latescibacterota bacterium]